MGNFESEIAKGVVQVGAVSDAVSDLISSKKQFIAKQIVNVFLLLLILLIFGCFDFLNLEFHYEYLAEASYWFDVGTKAVADICAYNIGVNFILDDVIKRNKTLISLKRIYDKLNDCKQDDFDEFLEEYNKQERVKAYKNRMVHKIYLLNKRARKKDIILYNRLIKTGKSVHDITNEKNLYCRKRAQLEYMRTNEYIFENIDSLNVRYINIESAVFGIEIDGAPKVDENKVTGSVSKGRAIASSSTLFGVIVWSMVFRSISLAPDQEQFENQMVAAAHYATKMAADIGIIIWQFMRGMLGTHKIVSQQITTPLSVRVKVLKEYYSWRRKKGLFVPDCYLNLLREHKDEDENEKEIEEVEMTKEEYEKLLKAKEKEVE